jgi:hypothetical protein
VVLLPEGDTLSVEDAARLIKRLQREAAATELERINEER